MLCRSRIFMVRAMCVVQLTDRKRHMDLMLMMDFDVTLD